MMLQLLLLVAGLACLLGGGDLMVRGGSGLARAFGVPPLVVGLSIVAFGTSAPELAVNVLAAISDRGEISFGNIMGSNMANIGLVLATAALIRVVPVRQPLIRREIPMMLLATLVALVCGLDGWFRGEPGAFDRSDGLVLLLLFGVFLYYTIVGLIDRRFGGDPLEGAEEFAPPSGPPPRVPLALFMTVTGIAGLSLGGRFTVDAAVELARGIGVSEALIGLTLIAIGTSLPELATSFVAATRGETDLAVGNIVGSNIFNLLFVLGVTSAISEVPVPANGALDMAVVLALTIGVLVVSVGRRRQIVRAEGLMLLLAYLAYVGIRAFLLT